MRRHLPGILCVWTPLVRVRRGCIDRLPNHRRRDRHFLHAHGRTRARHHRNCRLHSPYAQGRAQLGRLLERRDGEEVSSLLPWESRFKSLFQDAVMRLFETMQDMTYFVVVLEYRVTTVAVCGCIIMTSHLTWHLLVNT